MSTVQQSATVLMRDEHGRFVKGTRTVMPPAATPTTPTTAEEPVAVTVIKRGEGGRFLPGNPGGPGRLPERAVQLRDALLNAIEPEEIAKVGRMLLEIGLQGDLKAIEILLNKVMPKGASSGGTNILIQNNNNRERILAVAARIRAQHQAEKTQGDIVAT